MNVHSAIYHRGVWYIAIGVLAACNGDSSPPAVVDAFPADAECLTFSATPRLMLPGEWQLLGVTSDNQLVAKEGFEGQGFTAARIATVSLCEGTVTMVGEAQIVGVDGPVVSMWTGLDLEGASGALSVWTSAFGGVRIDPPTGETMAFYGTAGAAGVDGAEIELATFGAHVGANLWLASTATGRFTQLVRGVDWPNEIPQTEFLPSGVVLFTYRRFPGPPVLAAEFRGVVTEVSQIGSYFAVDATGKRGMLISSSPWAARPFSIDAEGTITVLPALESGVEYTGISDDGRTIVDLTRSPGMADLHFARWPGGAATALTTTGDAAGWHATPDGAHVVYSRKFNRDTYHSDLYLVATNTPEAPQLLVADQSIWFGGFSRDGRLALYFARDRPFGDFDGAELRAVPVVGGTPLLLAWNGSVVYGAARPGQLVFNENHTASNSADARADILAVTVTDTGLAAPPALIATQAEAQFFVSHDGSLVGFSSQTGAIDKGIYIAAVP